MKQASYPQIKKVTRSDRPVATYRAPRDLSCRRMDIHALARDVADAALSPIERVRFLNLCHETSLDGLQRSLEQVSAHLDYLEGAQTINQDVNLILAGRIAQTLHALIALGPYDAECRALIRGAVDYFTLTGDASDDLNSDKGLDDDARVVSAAARALGHPELEISLD